MIVKKKDWKEYNDMLVRRGEISLYIEPAALIQTKEVKELNDGKVGRPFIYGNGLVFAGFALKCLLRFGYRQVSGTVRDLLRKIDVPTPNFRTLWRRIKRLKTDGINFNINPVRNGEKIEVAIDSTGIRKVNDGEYRTKMYQKRKSWIKLHIAVDVRNGAILTRSITNENVHDIKETGHLLNPLYESISSLFADGAWDADDIFKLESKYGFRCVIPVRKNATRHCGRYRRQAVIEQFGLLMGRESLGHGFKYLKTFDKKYRMRKQKRWKKKFNYGKRWMVEGAYAKFKHMFGEYVFSNKPSMIKKEIDAKLFLYNSTIQ